MGIIQRITSLFRSAPVQQPDNFNGVSGSQQLTDPILTLNAKRYYIGLQRDDRLQLYKHIYYGSPLGQSAVNVLTKLVNTRPVFKSGNAEVDQRCREIWREIKGHQVNDQLIRQSLIYGFSVGEIVFPDFSKVEKVAVPDSPMIRFTGDEFGNVTGIVQIQGTILPPISDSARVDGRKCIVVRRDPVSSFDWYGSSLYQTAADMLDNLARALGATISVAMRIGQPKLLLTIPSEGTTPEQFKERMDLAIAALAKLQQDNATDMVFPVGVDVKVIGAETFTPFEKELWSIKEMICAAFNLPPLLLNILTQSGQGSESVGRQVVIQLQSVLDNIQESIVTAWNNDFWPLVRALEGMPVMPVMELSYNRLLETLSEEQGRTTQWENDLNEVVFGLREPAWLASRVDANGVFDPAALDEMIDNAREAFSPPKPDATGSDTTKATVGTKVSDKSQSNNKSG